VDYRGVCQHQLELRNRDQHLFDQQTDGITDAAAAGLNTAAMQASASYLNWGFDFNPHGSLVMPTAGGYPVLQWQNLGVVPSAASDFAGGDGSSGTPYQVSNVAQFNNISRSASYASKSFVLTGNIDFTGQEIAWIGAQTEFSGTFDGGYYTLSNVTIPVTESPLRSNVGLFSQLSGTVRI